MGKDGAPFFIATPTHAAPQEPLFEQLQEDLDTLLRSNPPGFLPRPLALKDGVADADEGKCTHTLLHTFFRTTLQLHPLSLSGKAAEEVPGRSMRASMATAADTLMLSPDRRDLLGNWRDTPSSCKREPRHTRYSSKRLKPSNKTKMLILAAPNHLCIHGSEHLWSSLERCPDRGFMGSRSEQLPTSLDPEVSSDISLSKRGSASLETLPWLLPPKGKVHTQLGGKENW